MAQFDSYGPQDQLQVEWISATEVRAWHPQFNPEYGPQSANYKPDNPIKLIFAQALGGAHSVFLWTLPSFMIRRRFLSGSARKSRLAEGSPSATSRSAQAPGAIRPSAPG